tara:strand:- start:5969 stop:8305 length:2337 start_codon:yes stop_codon:yes gene_type:complete
MLLEDFTKPVIKEAIADNIERLLNVSDGRMDRNAPASSYNSLVKSEPNWRNAESMGIESIPQRYFLGYTGDALDQIIQKFFYIGFDTRGNLDRPGNYHIWIGGKYLSAEFESARRDFYKTVYPGETEINPDTKQLQFVNFPVNGRANGINLKKWVNAKPKTAVGTEGNWFRIVPDGNLIRIDPTEDALTYKKLMNFSGFDEQGNRTSELLVTHREENIQRTIDDILKDQDNAKPLKDGDKAKLPGFKDKNGKEIIFIYKQVKDPNTGEAVEGYWLNPVNNKKIDRGSPEHEMLMAIKGKQPDGKTNLRPGDKSTFMKIWQNGAFRLSSYSNKGMRFQNDPKLNAMGKLFGVIGDVAGSLLKKPVQSFFDRRKGNRHDPDGKLFNLRNPDSFVIQIKNWRNSEDGLIRMRQFLQDLAKEFEQKYNQKPDLLKNYDKGFKFAPYGDNIFRLLKEIEDFVTPKFREGDVVGYVSKDGKPKKVVIIEMNPVAPTEVVVQDLEYYRSKGLKPQGPSGILIDKNGNQIRNKIFDPKKLFPQQESYRKKFEQAHPNVNLIKFLEQVGYNMAYHFGQSGTPERATTGNLAKMEEVYTELAGKKWEDKRKIKNPNNPEQEIYDTGPGTRHNVLNRFGIIVVNYLKLVDLDKLEKLLDEFKNQSEQDENDQDDPIFKPVQHKVGDVVLFIGGKNTSQQGKPIPAKIVGLKRNELGKPGQTVPMEGTCWVKSEQNATNGFEITTASLLTYEQYKKMREEGLIEEFEEWAAEPFEGEDPTDPNSPNFGNV